MIKNHRYRTSLLAITAILLVFSVFVVPDATTENVVPGDEVDLLSDKEYDPNSLTARRKAAELAFQQFRGSAGSTTSTSKRRGTRDGS